MCDRSKNPLGVAPTITCPMRCNRESDPPSALMAASCMVAFVRQLAFGDSDFAGLDSDGIQGLQVILGEVNERLLLVYNEIADLPQFRPERPTERQEAKP